MSEFHAMKSGHQQALDAAEAEELKDGARFRKLIEFQGAEIWGFVGLSTSQKRLDSAREFVDSLDEQ